MGQGTTTRLLGLVLTVTLLTNAAQGQPEPAMPHRHVDPLKKKDHLGPLFNFWAPHCQPAWNQCGIPAYDYGHNFPRAEATAPTLVAIQEATRLGPFNIMTLRKTFLLSPTALSVGGITLDKVGIMIYDNGQVLFSGRLFDQGGKQKNLIGHTVTVTLRAYAGVGYSPVNGPVVWQFAHSLRLETGHFETTGFSAENIEPIRLHFNEITGFDVTVRYEKGS